MGVFEELNSVNVNEFTEKKNGLTYLTWCRAWAEVVKRYPDANYTIWKDAEGRPYTYDERTGYMVYTTVTIDGVTREMWLPVMDGANKAMKAEPYTYKTKYDEKTVEAATMFDVNKTVMRCLTKNLAMFGLGLYIYAGEDLPDDEKEHQAKLKEEKAQADLELKKKVIAYINKNLSKEDAAKICACYKIQSISDMTPEHCAHYKKVVESKGGKVCIA